MTEIYLVRHPESALNADASVVGGRSNHTPLTERGEEQARRFAKAFASQYPAPNVFYSSPAVRTKALLDIYNETLGQHNGYFIDPDLQEMSQGEKEGVPRIEVYTPETLQAIDEQLLDFALPGGESLNDVANRFDGRIEQIAKRHPNSVVLIATHGQLIRAGIGRLLGWNHFETTQDPAHRTENVSLTRLSVENGQTTVNFWGKNIIEPIEIAESKLY